MIVTPELPELPGLTRIDGGWRIKTNDAGTHHIDILVMLVNIRIVLTPIDDPTGYDRFFCYEGNNFQTLMLAIGAASQWDGALDSEPFGWTKNGQTREIRHPHAATPQPSITCPRCQRTSYSLKDIEEGYCGGCHDWTTPR